MSQDRASWQRFREPLRVTLTRTVTIALAAGAAAAWWTAGRTGGIGAALARWPIVTLLALWPSLGGHWVELGFLNVLRPRLPVRRDVQVAARLAAWFAGGIVLALGMGLTAMALTAYRPQNWSTLWLAGAAFVGIELVVHLVLSFRKCDSFFNGRG